MLIDLRKQIIAEFDVQLPCNFINGVCSYVRESLALLGNTNQDLKNRYCCCDKCGISYGYSQYHYNHYKEYWDDKNGFHDRKTGCRLPRHLRPTICLVYRCSHIATNMIDKSDSYRLTSLYQILSYIDGLIIKGNATKKEIRFLDKIIRKERKYLCGG